MPQNGTRDSPFLFDSTSLLYLKDRITDDGIYDLRHVGGLVPDILKGRNSVEIRMGGINGHRLIVHPLDIRQT